MGKYPILALCCAFVIFLGGKGWVVSFAQCGVKILIL